MNKIDHPERVKTLYSELVIFAVLLGTAVIILINLFTRPLATMLGANDQTMGMAIKYLRLMS
ncbi:MATE family efflux transporter, partial [Agathobacter rectalis]|uniref:MATE family efflux transporter n=1 Tax=Agathobacter rectalis TaxID=39491 RepID=UPI0027D2CA1F